MRERFKDRYTLTPARYALVARLALVALTVIVLTGAAVRVTGSGLGCPTWPKCTDTSLYTELTTHGVIEFGNRLLTSVVGFAAIAAFLGAFRRRPFRRDLAWIALALPLGVVAQAVLGGFTVLYELAPGFVMSHYLLSMLILVACVVLDWRAHREPDGEQTPQSERLLVRLSWLLFGVGAVTIFAGTAATAAGPHAGGAGTGDVIKRLDFKGAETLRFVVEQHARLATALGVLAVVLWVLARRRGAPADQRRALTVLCLLLAAQGVIGAVQYQLELPAEIVWLHVTLAAVTWLAILWSVVSAGRPEVRGAGARRSGAETAAAA